MPQVWDKGRPPVWIFRSRPYDPEFGIERNVWVASTDVETDETYEGWLFFDGAGDAVVVPNDAALDLDGGTFSIGVRFLTSTAQDAVLVTNGLLATGGAVNGGWFVGLLATGSVRGSIADGGRSNADSAESYDDGQWHTLVYTFGGGIHTLYYDGVQVASVGTLVTVGANIGDVGIGALPSAGLFDEFEGFIERVVILNTEDQATAHSLLASRDLTKSVADEGPVAGMVAAYPINEGHSTRVQDVSGSGHHGTLQETGVGGVVSKWSPIAPPPGTIPGLLRSPFSVSGSLLRGSSRLGTRALPSFGAVGFNNPDGVLDHFAKYHWDARLTEHRLGLEGDVVTEYDIIWVGQAEQPDDVSKEDLSIAIRGVEDVFEHDVQQDLFQPGYEPYVDFDGVNDYIDFGDNLDGGAPFSFAFGVAFRTTADLQTAGLYGKKSGVTSVLAGYLIGLGGAGAIRIDLGDGSINRNVTHTPIGGYNSGERISVVGEVDSVADTARLYVKIGTGTWNQVGTVDISALGSVNNDDILAAGATKSGTSNFFEGEVERVCWQSGAGTSALNVSDCQAALDERYAEDFDALSPPSGGTAMGHYVPLTENEGTLVGDLGGTGPFDGTLTNFADLDAAWTGTPNGTKDFEGKPKPFMRGRKSLNPAVWIDNEKLIFMAFNGNFQNANVFSVREGFVPILEDTTTAGDIFTNPPIAGRWRQQVATVAGNTGVFVRLGSRPTGTITWSADYTDISINKAQFYPSTHFGVVALHVAGTLGGVIGQSDLEAAAPYISGVYWDTPIRGSRALDEILTGIDGHWTIDPRDPFDENGSIRPTVFQVRDLTGETPVATYLLDPADLPSDIAEDGFRQLGVAPVYRKAIVRYLRYQGFLSSGSEPQSIGGGAQVDFKLVTELMQEWRAVQAPATQEEIDAVLAAFKDAEEHRTDSIIWRRTDAETEAQRVFDLYNRLNRTYRVELTGGLFERWIGDVIAITATRILSSHGEGEVTKLFLVVGVDDDARNSGSRLELWGGFDPV